MLLLSFVARASAPPLGTVGFEHFGHEAFTREDGAPTAVNSIAQTPDGYLWLAAKGGLWRYDGSTFEQIEAPSGASFAGANAEMLLLTKRGELWVRHSIETVGAGARLEPLISSEIALIAKEIFNVARHAAAGHVDIQIVYERRSLTVRFADDGKGMDPEILRAGFRTGYFGLVGLRERGSKLNGSISFSNRRAGGLAIVVAIPADVAYQKEEGFRSRFLSSISGLRA